MITRLTQFFILAKHFEGCKLMPYYCPAGVLTCGYGATGYGVVMGKRWTQAQADKRLEQDALKFAIGALATCPVLATESDTRFSAIVDFAYNLGVGRLRGATLRKRINSKQWERVPSELMKWVRGGGKILRGLVLRRAAEVKLVN